MIENVEDLRALYATPSDRAIRKSLTRLDKHARHFIETSPFAILASYSRTGTTDASPRGGKAGFVAIQDDHTLVVPDFKGNNRLDSLANIVETGSVGLLFLIPGMDETLRVEGSAYLSTDSAFLDLFPEERNLMAACIVVNVKTQFLHCAKALMRSELWSTDRQMDRNEFPSMGQMLKDQLQDSEEPESREDMVKRYAKEL